MLKTFLAVFAIVAVSVVFLAVRLFFKKPFIHTDISGNKPLNDRGIHCVMEEERKAANK